MNEITATELKNHINDDMALLLLDVRETWEYEICAIPDSINIPMSLIPSSIEKLDKDDHIVVICHHGMRSMSVAQFLVSNGYSNITNLSGGIHAWAIEVDSQMEQY